MAQVSGLSEYLLVRKSEGSNPSVVNRFASDLFSIFVVYGGWECAYCYL